ncbi:LuxR C-terminal-related transcriptional regulator [Actinoplanes friuliensis]|uniref:LuxR family transcriptional regulator n=1 Tax=Actinoplanes friuliensis DSM 7358 TaxID=1246995 RepID=U5VVE8_9ACTN|nr:LuxR C-terminal-related transcriptional regulator [Actinoplanes friuliensis]AGZ40782.1 LuxR family transcriptional regulator [Actinoplanes friuliensis DSM 7358]
MSAPVLTGPRLLSPPGLDLIGQIEADPRAPLRASVGAPGGYGKTALLRELDRAARGAGLTVAAPWRPANEPDLLLVDDAHLLDEDRLDELCRYAEIPDLRLVVAHRPWPRPAAVLRLLDILRRTHPPVILTPLTEDQIRARLADSLRSLPSKELVAFVTAQTQGIPRFVERVAAAIKPALTTEPLSPLRVPAAALAPFATDIDELAPELRTLLLAVEAGAGLSYDLIAALLGQDAERVADLVEAGRATGLLSADGTLVPLARQAIAALGPIAQRIDVRQRLAASQLARGGPVLPLVRPLMGDEPAGLVPGAAGNDLGPVYEAAGEEALGDDPALAAQLFAAAAGAGRTTAARRALATALSGDLDQASRLADQALVAGTPDQRSEAAYVAAVVLTHRGQPDQADALYDWSRHGAAPGFGAVGLIATGRLEDARRRLADVVTSDPPTSLSATASLMARGVRDSVTASPTAALSALVRAAALIEPAGPGVLLADSPAALGAIIAVQGAELDTADTLLARAVRSGTGGALLAPRHSLLQAWILMLRGRSLAAEQHAPAAESGALQYGRDVLLGAALRSGLARRNSDLVGLRATWPDACQALIGQPVDLFGLLPLAELTVAAARLGEQHRVADHLAQADRLLAELGDPPLWSAPLHWSRLHAAILADDRASLEQHAAALARHRDFSPYAAATAAAAAAWLAVLSGRIDPDTVTDAARRLGALGLTWDATRLAGQAAIRTLDRKAMTVLLDCARTLQAPAEVRSAPATGGTATRSRATAGGQHLLSEREHEVAALVLEGLTYKQVAERLYLSAKTVEHHMARIRQRLGCADRQELLARLRAMIGGATEPAPAASSGIRP